MSTSFSSTLLLLDSGLEHRCQVAYLCSDYECCTTTCHMFNLVFFQGLCPWPPANLVWGLHFVVDSSFVSSMEALCAFSAPRQHLWLQGWQPRVPCILCFFLLFFKYFCVTCISKLHHLKNKTAFY